MFTVLKSREFANGKVYALACKDGYPIEVTDTFLPLYTKDCAHQRTNRLQDYRLGSRGERWMIGVSTMSGCPVKCKFCAAGQLKKSRLLTAEEIVAQVDFILSQNPDWDPDKAGEFKINYTRMGEPMLNAEAVRKAIYIIDGRIPRTHHYVSTIGIEGMDTSWIKDNITLQISLHSLDEGSRDWLIPFPRKMSIRDLGQIRTASALKTTLNMTLVDLRDFDIKALRGQFDPGCFFVKLSPINANPVSKHYGLGGGIIQQENLA